VKRFSDEYQRGNTLRGLHYGMPVIDPRLRR
jgi:hypothetical protein